MADGGYKFEQYRDRSFPVYASVQKGRERLVQPHFHDDAEFLLVAKGRVTVSVATEKMTCEAGDIVYIAPTAVHSVTALTGDAETHGLVFHPRVIKPFFEGGAAVKHAVYQSGGELSKELLPVLSTAVGLYGGEGTDYRLRMTACILALTAVLVQSGAISENAADAPYSRVRPATEYIEQHYAEKLSVSDLSRVVGLCDDRFIRVFREATGRTPTVYLTEYRLHEAMKLLATGQYTVSEVSDRTGFSDPAYFTRVFKQHLGVSPKGFKNSR